MSITATARPVAGLRHEVDVAGRHTIVTDEPEHLGGCDAGPTPHELLAAALAACASTMVVMYARNRGWELGPVWARAGYDPDSAPRRVTIELHLPAGVSAPQRERLERVARTCPVRRALESDFEFDERTVIEDPRELAA